MQIDLITKNNLPLIIETEGNDPDEAVQPILIGDEDAIAQLSREVDRGLYGYYGHLFSLDSTTNLDLQKIVYDLEEFEVVSVKPEITANKLPEGVMS